jgi:hypothetical protein
MNRHNEFSLLTAAAGAANTKKENSSLPSVVLSFAVIGVREFRFLFNRNSHIQLKLSRVRAKNRLAGLLCSETTLQSSIRWPKNRIPAGIRPTWPKPFKIGGFFFFFHIDCIKACFLICFFII